MKSFMYSSFQIGIVLIMALVWSYYGSVSMFEATTWLGIAFIISNQNEIRFKDD